MKYFNNITTTEEIKKQFRALSIKLHLDRQTRKRRKQRKRHYLNTLQNRIYLFSAVGSPGG